MRSFRLTRPSPSMAVALSALVLSGTASASAALLVTGANIKNGTVASVDIANGSIARADLDLGLRQLLGGSASSSESTVSARTGPAGPQGARGETGPAGPQGARGPQGPAGSSPVVARVGVSAQGINLGSINVGNVLRIVPGVYRVVTNVLDKTCINVVTPVTNLPISVSVTAPVAGTVEVRARDTAGNLVDTAFGLAVIC